ncbi:MAG: hypothetical protein IPI52_07395 [Bacteroidetes bacterium]|nr:hypothetical protein [Bacteroidota bacterium]
MKKITLKLSIVVMLFMTMVSCKKDITEELEAANEAANKEALLPQVLIIITSIQSLLMMEQFQKW